MGIKVIDVEETQTITLRQAILRDSIWLLIEIMGILFSVVTFFVAWQLTSFTLVLQYLFNSFATIWFLLGIVSMFTNRKRRAIHDFLAKTVVIREEQ